MPVLGGQGFPGTGIARLCPLNMRGLTLMRNRWCARPRMRSMFNVLYCMMVSFSWQCVSDFAASPRRQERTRNFCCAASWPSASLHPLRKCGWICTKTRPCCMASFRSSRLKAQIVDQACISKLRRKHLQGHDPVFPCARVTSNSEKSSHIVSAAFTSIVRNHTALQALAFHCPGTRQPMPKPIKRD